VPIPEKQPPPKPEAKPLPKAPPQHQPPPKPQNKANYGEAAPANVPRSTASNSAANSPIAQTGGDFGSRFGWYVDVIKRKVAQDWYLQEVDPSTPAGATVFIQFTVGRDGSPGSISLATPSSSPSLNSSCMHAVQRVLPSGYNESSLNVLYHCTYPGAR
jgi:protein TonB